MKEVHFFYAPDAESTLELSHDEAQHALRVLRLREGDELFLMDGCGCFYRAHLTLASPKHCLYTIDEKLPQHAQWQGKIHLAIAPTKMMERMEWMAEKATEVGFDQLTFLECKFSERKVLKTERIDKIIVSAMKQSRKPWKVELSGLTSFDKFIAMPRAGRKYICHCYDEIPKVDYFTQLQHPIISADDANVTILIGPEGDFSIEEVQLAMQHGYESVSLGASRLRTETAGLVAVTYAQLARRG